MPVYRMRTFSLLREQKDAVGVLWEGQWKPTKVTLYKYSELPKDIHFRHIIYRDPETKKVFHFITSDEDASSQKIADIYKRRWAVELLFRWLKGHLNIRYLPMKNLNAVKVQFSIFVLTQLLIQLGRIKSKFKGTLGNI
jgi:IS4 transposase